MQASMQTPLLASPLAGSAEELAILEGLVEIRFRERVLWLLGILPGLQLIFVACVLIIGQAVPVHIQTFGYTLVLLTLVNVVTLSSAWFVIRKRGTHHHHLYMLVLCAFVGSLWLVSNGWYLFLLGQYRARIVSICEGAGTSANCRASWTVITAVMTSYSTVVGALNLSMARGYSAFA